MESSENRRQSDTLPAMATYMEFERVSREGAQFHQRNSSINRTSISTASPISPTTSFGPPPLIFPQSTTNAPNGYISPPESRRTSGNEDGRQTLPSLEGRQSLPSLSEALYNKSERTFPAPSPMQTPPLVQGSFSSVSHQESMPRSQPPETLPSVGTLPLSSSSSSQLYSHPPPLPPPPPAPQSTAGPGPMHSHESYTRRNSQEHSRTLPPNPYANQAPPPPTIPAIRPSEPYPPSSNGHSSYQQAHAYPPPPPHHIPSPQYPPTPSYNNGNGTPQQYPFPQHPGAPPQQSSYQQHQQPPVHSSSYSYPSRDQGYQHEPPQTSPGSGRGLKRGNEYGSTIERALSMSALRRDYDLSKDHSSRIYYIVQQCQDLSKNIHPGVLDVCLRELSDAVDCSNRNTEALRSCQQVFQELCAKEYAEQNAQKMSTSHSSEYGGDDNHGYADDTRSNGSQQPDAKKIRRGRAAPPGRCHSCHRAETPEWRRGPDGARTLCNACGLHYAKLTRKLSKTNMSTGSGQIAGRKAPNSPLP